MKVENAVIMAAGASSRFAPLSYETHKAMVEVKGEVLIERQIQQLIDAGVKDITIITGYKKEQFEYLRDKYAVCLIENSEYSRRNNHSSIWTARNVLGNTYVCSTDNYFSENPFEQEVEDAYYAAEYAEEDTNEWCLTVDSDGYIDSVTIGGSGAWYMMGHTFWSDDFSRRFLHILEKEYHLPETAGKLWESIYAAHLQELKMQMRKYKPGVIFEFDTLDELRQFDSSYNECTRSRILRGIASEIGVEERRMRNFTSIYGQSIEAIGFEFDADHNHYKYEYQTRKLERVLN